jgi:hypothetical protein
MASTCTLACCKLKIPVCAPGCHKVAVRLDASLAFFLGLQLLSCLRNFALGTLFSVLAYTTGGLFLTSLAIALGQAVAAACFGGRPATLVIWSLGGVVTLEVPLPKYGQRIVVALSGALMCVLMLLLWLGAFSATGCRLCVRGCEHFTVNSTEHCRYDVLADELRRHGNLSNGRAWFAEFYANLVLLNAELLLISLALPFAPLPAATLLVSFGQMCGRTPHAIARCALCVSCMALILLIASWLVAAIASDFENLSMLTVLCTSYLLWHTRKLWRAIRTDKLAQHSLFAAHPPAVPADPSATSTGGGVGGGNGSLSVALVANDQAAQAGAGPAGSWNPFRQERPAESEPTASSIFAGTGGAGGAFPEAGPGGSGGGAGRETSAGAGGAAATSSNPFCGNAHLRHETRS